MDELLDLEFLFNGEDVNTISENVIITYCDDQNIDVVEDVVTAQGSSAQRQKNKRKTSAAFAESRETKLDCKAAVNEALVKISENDMLMELYGSIIQENVTNNLAVEILQPVLENIIIKPKSSSSLKAKETIWCQFFSTANDEQILSELRASFSAPKEFISWFLLNVFKALVAQIERSGNCTESTLPTKAMPLTTEDKDVVTYIAGFVLQKLHGRLHRLKCKSKDETSKESVSRDLKILGQLEECDSSGLVNGNLIHILNRGGLTYPSARICDMFSEVEQLFRKTVRRDSRSIDSERLLFLCLQSDSVKQLFKAALNCTEDLHDSAMSILKACVNLYIKIRCHSHANKTIDMYRLQTKTTTKKKGIRKSLKDNSKSKKKKTTT